MVIDPDVGRPFLGAGVGGLSGPAIRPIAVRCVYQVAGVVSIPIIGIGGIVTGSDALQFFLAGASSVQVGTATFREPRAAERLVTCLHEYLEQRSHESINDIIGSARQ